MPLDALCLSQLAAEMDARLTGAAVDKIHQPAADTLVLSLRTREGHEKLLLCGGTGARVHLTADRFENPDAPPMFCMLLRKHLTGGRVVSVTQPYLERMVDITIDTTDALGDRAQRHLIAELISPAGNIILTDAEGRVTDCLRRLSGDMSGRRSVLPGLFYRPPEKQNKRDPFATPPEEKLELLRSAPEGAEIAKVLLDSFLGLSPLICREAVSRACGDASARLGETLDGDKRTVAALEDILRQAKEGKGVPCLLLEGTRPRDFSFTEIGQYGGAVRLERTESFSALLDAFYTRRARAETMRLRAQGLFRTVRSARGRLERKLAAQKTELLATFDREEKRQCGDILMANLMNIPRGASVFTADDFYGEEGARRTIRLDPARSPQQNAAKYYKDFNRAKNAEKILTEQIDAGEKELAYLESVAGELERAASERDLSEIRQELEDAGYLKKQKTGKKNKRPVSKPMRFVTDKGFEVRAGRTGTQNDELTKSAARTDIWLHTQKIHGSHAVLSCAGQTPDEETIRQAARIAAYYSQGRGGTNVPVDYTLVKHVKKPAGARPGMVIYTDQRTVYVTPDEPEAERLKKE